MNGLFDTLMQRQAPQQAKPQGQGGGMPPGLANGLPAQAQGQPPPLTGLMPQGQAMSQPSVQAPNPHTQVPPAMDRFQNGQMIQQAIGNNWTPNPVLLRA